MGNIWKSAFLLLTALQVTPCLAAVASIKDDNPRSLGHPAHQALPSSLPLVKRDGNDSSPSDVLTSPAKVITSFTPSGTVQILANKKKPASGRFHSTLDTTGHCTSVPILTSPIPKPTSLLSAASVVVSLKAAPSIAVESMAQDIFADPISTDAPPTNIGRKQDHPAPRLGITAKGPLETNKFYANFFLGSQTSPSFLHPYSVAWAKGQGAAGSWGLAISHIDSKQRVYGPNSPGTGAASYFINPIGIQSVCLSAKELGSATALTTDSLTDFSVQVNLRPNAQAAAAVQFPLVQGSAFITAVYNGASPVVQTGVFFRTVTRATADPKAGVTKYKLLLEDGVTWLVYAYHTQGDPLDLTVVNNGLAQAKGPFYGTIQVTKDPGNGETVYDQACGAYPTGVRLSGSTNGASGTYTFSFNKSGMSGTTLAMFALPHHQASFDGTTRAKLTSLQLQTTTKGVATAIVADSWTMVESNLPTDMGFLPWVPQVGTVSAISDATKKTIHNIAQQEVSQNILQQTDQSSMYFGGKVRTWILLVGA